MYKNCICPILRSEIHTDTHTQRQAHTHTHREIERRKFVNHIVLSLLEKKHTLSLSLFSLFSLSLSLSLFLSWRYALEKPNLFHTERDREKKICQSHCPFTLGEKKLYPRERTLSLSLSPSLFLSWRYALEKPNLYCNP